MEKPCYVPMSRPHRAIVVMNSLRSHYSVKHTWEILNAYYLSRCMTESEYKQVLDRCS